MPITKATSNVLATDAALNNLNTGSSVALSVPLTVTSTASINGNFTVDTNTLFVNAANDRVGIGTASPTEKLDVAGNVKATSLLAVDATLETVNATVSATAPNLVYTTNTDQDIDGNKTFLKNIVGNGTDNRLPSQIADKPESVVVKSFSDLRYGILGAYNLAGESFDFSSNFTSALGPLFTERYGFTYSFNFGGTAGSLPQIVFIPFFLNRKKTFSKCAIAITAGNHPTSNIDGAIYLPDENGFPLTRLGEAWEWAAGDTGKVETDIGNRELEGLFYVGIRPQLGAVDWRVGSQGGSSLVVRGVSQGSMGILAQIFGVARTLNNFDGAVGVTATSQISTMPINLSSPEIRRSGLWASGNQWPVAILY
jgi:hypothetical protein